MFCSEHLERAGLYIKGRDGKHFPISSPTEDPVSRNREPLKFSLKIAPTNFEKVSSVSYCQRYGSTQFASEIQGFMDILKGRVTGYCFFCVLYIFLFFGCFGCTSVIKMETNLISVLEKLLL